MKHKESVSGDWKGLYLHSYSIWQDPEVQRLTLQMRNSFPSSFWLSSGLVHIIAHNSSAWVCCYLGQQKSEWQACGAGFWILHAVQAQRQRQLRHQSSNITKIMRTQKHEIFISLRRSKRQAFCYTSCLSEGDERFTAYHLGLFIRCVMGS